MRDAKYAALRGAMARLPAAQRQALAGHYLSGRTVRALSRDVGVPEGTVKSHLHRGRAALRDDLLRQVVIEVATAAGSPLARLEDLVRALEAAGTVGAPAVAAARRAVPRHHYLPNLARRAHRARDGTWVLTDEDPAPRPTSPARAEDMADAHADAPAMVGGRHGRVAQCPAPGGAASLLEALDVHIDQSVVEVGTGAGYRTALLCHLVGQAGTVETCDADASGIAAHAMRELRRRWPTLHWCDTHGSLWGAECDPVDRLLATAPSWGTWLRAGGPACAPKRWACRPSSSGTSPSWCGWN